MTQFKEKSEGQDFVSAGLFTYPVLMAGDILLYQTEIVPIGDDQRQHLELTRDVAERFNQRYGETFTIPRGVYPEEGARIKNLQEPERLMSTTRGAPQGVVRMVDEPDVIRKKFKTAVTDSEKEIRHAPDTKAGISNLLEIMSVATGEPVAELERRFDGSGYGEFKEAVGEAVVALLAPIQERYRELRADERELQRLLAVGAEKARRCTSAWASSRPRPGGSSAQPGRAVCRVPPEERVTASSQPRHHGDAHAPARGREARPADCGWSNRKDRGGDR
jgi:tryptophanyl-tRNA synthetase